jgi:hypothetical protein
MESKCKKPMRCNFLLFYSKKRHKKFGAKLNPSFKKKLGLSGHLYASTRK